MVHTLHEIHRVLKPDGTLLDLRPDYGNRSVAVTLPYADLFVGEIDSSMFDPDKLAADKALQQTIHDGLFVLEHQEAFDFVVDMDTVDDLREFAESFDQSILSDAVIEQVESLLADEDPDAVGIRVRRPMHVARYRKQITIKP
jgi:phosphoribosylformylglycinamidine (FGAM) synthase PurS component